MIEVNSARRRERIAKEISKRFGSRATLVETKTSDIVKELQDRRARRGETAEPMTPSTEPERTPEIQALEAELMQKNWDAWIDTKVPALWEPNAPPGGQDGEGSRAIGGAPQQSRALNGTGIIRVPTGSRRLAAAVGTRLSAVSPGGSCSVLRSLRQRYRFPSAIPGRSQLEPSQLCLLLLVLPVTGLRLSLSVRLPVGVRTAQSISRTRIHSHLD